jgi:hypothetical protein
LRNIRSRLAKLEAAVPPPSGRCPDCPPPGPVVFVDVDAEGNLLSGAYPPRCARCGGPHGDGIRFVEVVLPAVNLREPEALP